MGSFGDSISSLLDTYTRCLSLLKGFSQGKPSASGESTSGLRSAIRKARARVRRDYSSKLSQNGDSFKKGDATSKSSVKRIIDKLKTTLSNLGTSKSKGQPLGVDYASLVSLCDSSRTDAMRTMTDLSSRISSKRSHSKVNSAVSRRSRGSSHLQKRKRVSKTDAGHRSRSRSQHHARKSHESHRKRISRLTMSSDSTKLGEIRGNGSSHPRSTTAYPRYSHYDQVKTRGKKKWWSFLTG